jgi:hypothetical protein
VARRPGPQLSGGDLRLIGVTCLVSDLQWLCQAGRFPAPAGRLQLAGAAAGVFLQAGRGTARSPGSVGAVAANCEPCAWRWRTGLFVGLDDYASQDVKPALLGWFDSASARRWEEDWDGVNRPTSGQALNRTSGGKWVLSRWSAYTDTSDTHGFVTSDEAREWLLAHHCDEVIAEFFGAVAEEEDRRPGRPAIGEPVNVRLGELLGRVDAYATATGASRAEAIRALVAVGLTADGH